MMITINAVYILLGLQVFELICFLAIMYCYRGR